MQKKEFVDRVMERTGVEDEEQAVRAVDAVLTTLGERLGMTERENLAAQLPDELKEPVLALRERTGDVFSVEEFYNRVAARAGVRSPHPTVAAVLSVLHEAVSPGQWDDIFRQLPDEYGDLQRPVGS